MSSTIETLPQDPLFLKEKLLLTCPITGNFFVHPVVLSDGLTVEHSAIEAYLQLSNPINPVTNKPITNVVISNLLIEQLIKLFLEKYPTENNTTNLYHSNIQIINSYILNGEFERLLEFTHFDIDHMNLRQIKKCDLIYENNNSNKGLPTPPYSIKNSKYAGSYLCLLLTECKNEAVIKHIFNNSIDPEIPSNILIAVILCSTPEIIRFLIEDKKIDVSYIFDVLCNLHRVDIPDKRNIVKITDSTNILALISLLPVEILKTSTTNNFTKICEGTMSSNTVMLKLVDYITDLNAIITDYNFSTTLFHIACKYCGIDDIKKMISNGANYNIQNTNGDTPFHIACEYNNSEEVVEYLLETIIASGNTDIINLPNKYGCKPLHSAVLGYFHKNGITLELVLKLIDFTTNLNECTPIFNSHINNKSFSGMAFIHMVCIYFPEGILLPVLEKLKSLCVDFNILNKRISDEKNNTPFGIVCRNSTYNVIKKMRQCDIKIGKTFYDQPAHFMEYNSNLSKEQKDELALLSCLIY